MSSFAGTGTLLRLHARRDRVRIPIWVVSLTLLMLASVASVTDLYATQESLEEFARTVQGNPAIAALNGRPVALDTIGGRVSFEVLVFTATTVGLMSLLLVSRHTRGEEEAGRTELLRALVLGRHAQPAAAAILVAGTNVLVGLSTYAMLVAFDLPAAGSLVLAAGITLVGLVFTAIAIGTAQLTEHARAANGIAGGILGAAFGLRAAGDAGVDGLSWFSPIGWAQAAEPYAQNRWWPLVLGLAVAGVVFVGSLWLAGRRDVGSAFIATRPGRARASAALSSPLALAARLQRGALIGWLVGITAFASVYGLLAQEIESFFESTPEVAEYFAGGPGTLLEGYLATVAVMLALATTGYVIQGLLRLRSEEDDGRAELVLAAPVSRLAWAGGHVVVVLAGSVVILGLAGAAAGLIHGLRSGDLSWAGELAMANLVQVPGVWVLAGVALLLHGAWPRGVLAAWGGLAVAVVITFFAEPLQLPAWVRDLSPFTHLPQLPAAELSIGAPLAVLAVAVVLGAGGIAALRHRDLATG